MQDYWVVVDDPAGDWLEGSVVDANRAQQLRARGTCVLPFDPGLARQCGVGGYMRRGWGAGYPIDSSLPRMHCPLTVFTTPDKSSIHWAVRLEPSKEVRDQVRALLSQQDAPDDTGILGSIQLAADPSQPLQVRAGLEHAGSPVHMSSLGRPDERGGWTVVRHAQAIFAASGAYGFGIYGWAPLRVAWAAISIVAKEP